MSLADPDWVNRQYQDWIRFHRKRIDFQSYIAERLQEKEGGENVIKDVRDIREVHRQGKQS